jgi:hypothetical protein
MYGGIVLTRPGFLVRCANRKDCASRTVRVGFEAIYAFGPGRLLNPWLGVGTGFELSGVYASTPSASGKLELYGLELPILMAGLDVRLTRVIGVGGFLTCNVGTYFGDSNEGVQGSVVVDDSKHHAWIEIGGRLILFP